ncbi:MAG: phosphoribosylformylglycinamidine synthase [Clostridiales bacterium]|nr:phosphoribosylformylglycinamidine synthase [Clostridiales bacterium]
MAVRRVFVERRQGFDAVAARLLDDIRGFLQVPSVSAVRRFYRFDVEGFGEADFARAVCHVLSDPPIDATFDALPLPEGPHRLLAVESLPGQYDERADLTAQCLQLMAPGERPAVACADVYLFEGALSEAEFSRIRAHLINPVECREAAAALPDTLAMPQDPPAPESTVPELRGCAPDQLPRLIEAYGLAMDADDLACVQRYFEEEGRDPTLTELRLLDTYWSDHCRHTTFHTRLDPINIQAPAVSRAYARYLEDRAPLRGDRPVTLMDLATFGARHLKHRDLLGPVEESEEVNACSVNIQAAFPDGLRDYLLLFKNETHNHPTEIEPFGGASTCLGGGIRDPLSSRAYVYQSMRITGAADPRTPLDQTLPGKLPQRKITTTALTGYSTYGSLIGQPAGYLDEIYHPGYVAKRMECGALVAAAPAENVVRQAPQPGDLVLLLGGRTGRDGLGAATGSSRPQTLSSLTECGAEVQKGSASEERKIVRLFRNGACTKLIKRCNDFGAGGASVAIGELCDGVTITLDAIPAKYEGLSGGELALSESQERMACVVAAADLERFRAFCAEENLEATVVAEVTEEPRLKMTYRGETLVDLSRELLNSSGAPKRAAVQVEAPAPLPQGIAPDAGDAPARLRALLADLNVCSRGGLLERFDSTAGAATLLSPAGGRHQAAVSQAMAARLPSERGDCLTASLMAYGFCPTLSEASPFHGAVWAVCQSICRLVASGGDRRTAYLSFQEFFERMSSEAAFGKPFAALLGAYLAQMGLEVGAVGGKDSMSGSFEGINVPPTLLSFAVCTAPAAQVVSPEFKRAGERVTLLRPPLDADGLPDFEVLRGQLDEVTGLCGQGRVSAAYAVGFGGVAEGVAKLCFGNRLGFAFDAAFEADNDLFEDVLGGILLVGDDLPGAPVGVVTEQPALTVGGQTLPLEELLAIWEAPLAELFPVKAPVADGSVVELQPRPDCRDGAARAPAVKAAKPRVLLPLLPGTNGEYDCIQKLEAAGARCDSFVLHNLTGPALLESLRRFEHLLAESQILLLPAGYAPLDQPGGSGRFYAALLRQPRIREAFEALLARDGLVLGIGSGFQALLKTGLLPGGRFCDPQADAPALAVNAAGWHRNRFLTTKVCSVCSPWLSLCEVGETFVLPVSGGEGRLTASPDQLATLAEAGQIATRYVDPAGHPASCDTYNPTGSAGAVEGLSSPCGRILGKSAHSERVVAGTPVNIPGLREQPLLAAGVRHFS